MLQMFPLQFLRWLISAIQKLWCFYHFNDFFRDFFSKFFSNFFSSFLSDFFDNFFSDFFSDLAGSGLC